VDRLVVVGASLAGLRAVEGARRAGFTGRIILIGAEQHPPYDRLPLSKAHLDPDTSQAIPGLRSDAELSELEVDLRLGSPATALDSRHKQVHVGGRRILYDALVIATGAAPKVPAEIEGVHGIQPLRTWQDARAIRSALDARARIVVVGAGFIGAEVASAARRRGLTVTVIEAAETPMAAAVGPEAGRAVARLMREGGVDLRVHSRVTDWQVSRGRVCAVRLDDGSLLDADLVVLGTGCAPATGWLASSGIELDPHDGGVVCDATLRSSLPEVYAAGDLAHVPSHLVAGELLRVGHWTHAAAQGLRAGENAVDPAHARPFDDIPYFWSDLHGHRVQLVGVPASDAIVTTDDPLTVLYRHDDRLVGALMIDGQRHIMKLRRVIADGGDWAEAPVSSRPEQVGRVAEAAGRR